MKLPSCIAPFARENEALAGHTTFKTGGAALLYVKPDAEHFVQAAQSCIQFAREQKLPLFVLGGGSNLCVSDAGLRALVLDTGALRGVTPQETEGGGVVLSVFAGTPSSELAAYACESGFCGLEFLAGLPGTAGGALVMNARCFEKQISDVLIDVQYLDTEGHLCVLKKDVHEWDYKKSPFQNSGAVIIKARLAVQHGNKNDILNLCTQYQKQREEKGHYRFPSAGSVFKNNRAFGKSSGALIDELGLRGVRRGGAQIAPWHGNFIINTGGATSANIRALVELVKAEARARRGFELEEEVLFVGEW